MKYYCQTGIPSYLSVYSKMRGYQMIAALNKDSNQAYISLFFFIAGFSLFLDSFIIHLFSRRLCHIRRVSANSVCYFVLLLLLHTSASTIPVPDTILVFFLQTWFYSLFASFLAEYNLNHTKLFLVTCNHVSAHFRCKCSVIDDLDLRHIV